MFTSLYIVRKLNSETSPEVNRVAAAVEQVAEERHLFLLKNSTACNQKTLIIAVGGDGTMLEAMRIAARTNAVAMGVNLGRVGFLTDFVVQSTDQAMREVIANVLEYAGIVYPIETRRTLAFWIETNTNIAANEVSLSRDISDAMITYKLRFDDVDAGLYRANSILVATPSGSTAYSLSAGGALMLPSLDAVQVVPVAPLTMTARPIIVPHKTVIEIQAWGGKLAVRADGQSAYSSTKEYIQEDPLVMHVVGDRSAQILHSADWNYFDMLTNKLGWIKE